ncbi:helix-turn-helix domain-containing protein [Rhodococcus sp. NPDC060176]|uniref:helix-turn-helix domain-containing protein n=1 Tax=Rhodococcus sp. NPDC060176 TaxID=3347062 RepID=UPI0036580AE3
MQGTSTFARRLNTLCARSERWITNRGLAEAMADRGCDVSPPYLSQLRRGVRADPSAQIVEAFADFFGVTVDYFFSPVCPESHIPTPVDGETLVQVANETLRRLLVCTFDLSHTSLYLLLEFADHLRAAENLPYFCSDAHIYSANKTIC